MPRPIRNVDPWLIPDDVDPDVDPAKLARVAPPPRAPRGRPEVALASLAEARAYLAAALERGTAAAARRPVRVPAEPDLEPDDVLDVTPGVDGLAAEVDR